MTRRAFNANPPAGIDRCSADRKPLRDGTGAQCMRRAVRDGFCAQHAKAAEVDPCPKGDPECETGDDGSCHDGCESPFMTVDEQRAVDEAQARTLAPYFPKRRRHA